MAFKSAIRVAVAAVALLPTAAFAHPDIGESSGIMHGLAHPVSGLDHILAMVMVGVLAYQLGGRALWLVPVTFVAVMALGGGLGIVGIQVPMVELGIALSVIVLGACVLMNIKAPVALAMGLVGFFAVFHGYAHGAEMPAGSGGLTYAVGFLVATALLHVAGIGLGFLIGKAGDNYGSAVVRSSGGLAAVAGLGILTGVL